MKTANMVAEERDWVNQFSSVGDYRVDILKVDGSDSTIEFKFFRSKIEARQYAEEYNESHQDDTLEKYNYANYRGMF